MHTRTRTVGAVLAKQTNKHKMGTPTATPHIVVVSPEIRGLCIAPSHAHAHVRTRLGHVPVLP